MKCNLEKLDDEAWRVFSIFIRNRDCPDGYGACICCGKPIRFNDCDAAHFIPRQHMSLKFDERNVNACCRECNRMKYGNLPGYTIGLVEKYGDGIIEELKALKKYPGIFKG